MTPTHWDYGLELLLAVIAAAVCFFIGLRGPTFFRRESHETARPGRVFAGAGVAAGGSLLIYKALFFIPGVTQRFPELPDVLAAGVFLLVGAVGYFVRSTPVPSVLKSDPNRPKRLWIILAMLAVFSVFERPVYLTIQGPKLAQLDGPFEDGVCFQSTSFTCVSASGATALASIGVKTTEGELAFLTGTTWRGTGFHNFRDAVRLLGERLGRPMDVRSRILTWEELQALEGPALLETWWKGSIRHSTAYVGTTNGLAILGEPTEGKLVVSRDELTGPKWKWKGRTHVIVQEP